MTDECGVLRILPSSRSASRAPSVKVTTTRRSTGSLAGVPQPPRCHRLVRPSQRRGDRHGGREVRASARGAAWRSRRHHRTVRAWPRPGWSKHGYDEQMGARPMARVIQEHIKKPLADEVLFGNWRAAVTSASFCSRTRPTRPRTRSASNSSKGRSRRSGEAARCPQASAGQVQAGWRLQGADQEPAGQGLIASVIN
ncbi:hypothetical protein ACRAWF_06535 [Streptomyces sp. L7]